MAPAVDERTLLSDSSSSRPLYIASGPNRLFAWLHRPITAEQMDVGVVICNPFGYEAICAHRSIRTFAEELAGAGVPVIRFDYSGAGDSSDIDEDADLVSIWCSDLKAAADALRMHTGVRRVCLMGLRLGALFAGLAAAEGGIDSLILIGPVVNGRKYVRELRTTQLAGIALSGSAESETERSGIGIKALEAGGFSLSPLTQRSLGRLDLIAMPPPPVNSTLILDSDKLPTAQPWAGALARAGVRVDYETRAGLIEMLMTAPQFAVVPIAMVESVKTWLIEHASAMISPAASSLDTSPELIMAGSVTTEAPIVERPLLITGGPSLFGVLCQPVSEEKRRRAIILLNPGADHHIGASRMYVSLARRWARRGYSVLRLDFAGIGDSATRVGSTVDEVFPDAAIDDIRRTIEYLNSRCVPTDLTLAGLCSGAYHALRAAVARLPLDRILLVNPQNYFWKKGMTLDQIQLAEVVHNPGLYRRQIFSLRAWLRMFTGRVNVFRISGIYLMSFWLSCEGAVKGYGRRMGLKFRHDLGGELETIVAGGVQVSFVFARGEPGIELLKLQAGSTPWRLGEGCRVAILESGDHIFSRKAHRRAMEDMLSEELYARSSHLSRRTTTLSRSLRQLSAK